MIVGECGQGVSLFIRNFSNNQSESVLVASGHCELATLTMGRSIIITDANNANTTVGSDADPLCEVGWSRISRIVLV